MTLPASGYFSTALLTTAFQTSMDAFRDVVAQMLGSQARSEIVISGGAATAVRAMHTIDTEGGASTDELDTLDCTALENGAIVFLFAEDAARVVELRHNQTGPYQLLMRDGQSVFLDTLNRMIAFRVDKTTPSSEFLTELFRVGYGPSVITKTANYAPTADQAGCIFTNLGAGGAIEATLPSARLGLGPFTFAVYAAQEHKVIAAAGDVIRIDASESAAAGDVKSSTPGDVVTLVAIDATTWLCIGGANLGGWTVT